MEGSRRVYPSGRGLGKWMNYLMLFLSAVLVLSGLVWRGGGDGLELSVAATPTPIPTDASFDETMESRELTLPSRTWYALQLGAFESAEAAESLAEGFRGRGAAGYVWKDSRYRVLAALYATREDLQTVRTRLSESRSIDSYPYEITLSPLKLRMKGMKGQLDILEAGFLHGHDLVEELQSLSIRMDQQEVSAAEAVETLGSLSEQTGTVSLRISQRFTAPRHAAVQGLMDLFDRYAAFARRTEESMGLVELATAVKHECISALYGLKGIYDSLSDT